MTYDFVPLLSRGKEGVSFFPQSDVAPSPDLNLGGKCDTMASMVTATPQQEQAMETPNLTPSRAELQRLTRAALDAMASARPQSTPRQRTLDVVKVARSVDRHATRAATTFKGNCQTRTRLSSAADVAKDVLTEVKGGRATTDHALRLARAVTRALDEALCYCGNGAVYMTAIDHLRDAQDDAGLVARGCALREPGAPKGERT